ncbi:adenine nucleotide alpha hydrolase family protein [Haloarcula sp. H-GB5]
MAKQALKYALEAHPNAEITRGRRAVEDDGNAVGLTLEDVIQQVAKVTAKKVFAEAREISDKYDAEIDTDVGWGSPRKVICSINR